jgi:hypothetical protein
MSDQPEDLSAIAGRVERFDFKLWTEELDDGCRLAWWAFELALVERGLSGPPVL